MTSGTILLVCAALFTTSTLAADGENKDIFVLSLGYSYGFNAEIGADSWIDKFVAGTYNIESQKFVDAKTPWQPSSYDDVALVHLDSQDYLMSQYRTVWKFNEISKQWTQMDSLKSVGKRHSSVVIDDKAYICGGCGCAENRSCEYWSNAQPYWQHTARMKRNRYDHCVTKYDGKMFVFAGREMITNAKLTLAEIYTPSTDVWSDGAENFPLYTKCTATLHRDFIYVCGYNTGSPSHCAKYNPRNHTWEWASTPKSAFGNGILQTLGLLTVRNDRLYWLDNARNVYKFNDDTLAWDAEMTFNPKVEAGLEALPTDLEPRAVVGF